MNERNTLASIAAAAVVAERNQQQQPMVPFELQGNHEQEALVDFVSDDEDEGEQQSILTSTSTSSTSIITTTEQQRQQQEEEEEATVATAPTSNRSIISSSSFRGGSSGRNRFLRPLRIGAPSWWTELRDIETSGCVFVFAYIILSFFLMTTMFNMREIVGDYLLGNHERKEQEYRANVEKAMEIRRRSPWDTVDQEDRFEKESEANLYYDHQGQVGDDTKYLRHHRVPIIRPGDEDEKEDDRRKDIQKDNMEP